MHILGGSDGKDSACQYRKLERHRFNPWVRKILWRKEWQPTPVFLPGEFHGQRSLAGYSPWCLKESHMTEQLTHTHTHTHTHIFIYTFLCRYKNFILTIAFSPSLGGRHVYVLAGRPQVCTAGLIMSPGLTTGPTISTAPEQSSPILLDSLFLLFLPGNLF